LPRRRERLAVDPPEPEQLEKVAVARHDPAEIRFYIKQLKKAIRYLPLGSRAYYAVSGELLRATRELNGIVPSGSPPKGPTQ